jgi:hypothetical protein
MDGPSKYFLEVPAPMQKKFKVDFPDGSVIQPSGRAGYVRVTSIQFLPVLTISRQN